MNKILILFSSLKEANSLIYQSGLKFEKRGRSEYHFNNIIVYIAGIGKKAVEKMNSNQFKDIAFVIKAGACALLDNNIPLCKAFIPSIVQYKSSKIQVDLSNLSAEIRDLFIRLVVNKTLLTLDESLFDEVKAIDLLNSGITFVDMETFFVAEKFRGIPVFSLIVGTDRGSKSAKKDFLKMLPKASEILKNELLKFISQ